MRILVCTNAYPPNFVGGAELVAHNVARQFVQLGHDVVVFAGDITDSRSHYTIKSNDMDGVQIYRIATRLSDYDHCLVNYVHSDVEARFAEILDEFKPEVMHAHNLVGLSVNLLVAAAESGARVFVTLHDFWGFCLRNTLMRENGMPCDDRTACAMCLRKAGDAGWDLRVRRDTMALAFEHVIGFIAPSRFLADAYLASGFPRDRMVVIPNGVDTAPFAQAQARRTPDTGGPIVLLFAGHLGRHKGLFVLLRALSLMRHRDRVRLDLVGDGPDAARLRALVRRLGLFEHVRFRGKIQGSAMPDVYAACDVCVLSSIWPENQPVCLMEAMACAKPVIASRVGGIPDMIADGVEGILVPPNAPRELADALDRMVAAPDLRLRMGLSGRARVSSHSYNQQALALLELFARNQPEIGRSTDARPIMALIGEQAWCGDRVESSVQTTLHHETGYAIPYAWLSAQQRTRISAFMSIRPKQGKYRLLQQMFGLQHSPVHPARLPIWLRKVLMRPSP